ncbi:MAG: hypothetical protein HXX11_01925 [Desulfuromonadales bacterium]|nr:hypothetical protein [Desulfuromonadales bacterium]
MLFLMILCLYPVCMYLIVHIHDSRYPPTITNSLSFDAKIKFLRQNRHLFDSRTVIAGSSMCLNNIDADFLRRTVSEAGPLVNLGAWGLQLDETRYFLGFFLEHAPRVRTVVLIGQAVDFGESRAEQFFNRSEVWSYITGQESILQSIKHFNLLKAIKNWQSYDQLNRTHRQYEGLLFDETGTALLDISPTERKKRRWDSYGLSPVVNKDALGDLEKLCKEMRGKGLRFIFVIPPVRQEYRQHAESLRILTAFKQRTSEILARNGGQFVDGDEKLALQDDCFIDMMHLNQRGARRVAELLAPLL